MPALEQTLQHVAATLEKLRVPYALIGGFAVIARGVVRATKDVDFLVDFPIREAPALAQSLSDNGLPATFRMGGANDPIVGIIRITIPTDEDPIQCDILFPTKLWQLEAVRKATPIQLNELDVRVVQAEDLFLLKLYAGGPQDLLDAFQLLKLQSEEERARWKDRAAKIGRSRMFERCVKIFGDNS